MLSNNSTITRSTAIGAKKTLINKQKTSWQGILYQYHSTTPFNGLWSQYIPFQITNGVQSYYVLKTKSDSSINDGFNNPIIGRLKKKYIIHLKTLLCQILTLGSCNIHVPISLHHSLCGQCCSLTCS